MNRKKRTKSKVSKRKAVTNIRAEINQIETKKTIEKINETKIWFFEKMNKTDKLFARFTKIKREIKQNQK